MPPEILEQIFKDAFNLINLSRTCCRFNELISSSPVLMNKIVLKLDKFIENSFEREDYLQFLDSRKALLASSRPFRHVLIENDYHSKYIKILKKNSASISSLTISSEDDDNFLDGDDLIKVLKVLSNSLTSIELNAVGSLSFHKPDVILMPKLKSLKLFNWSFEILQLFMNSRITDLRIEMTDGNFNRWNIKFLVDFLSVQVDLKVNFIMNEPVIGI